jgi:DNA primase catalytic subunit
MRNKKATSNETDAFGFHFQRKLNGSLEDIILQYTYPRIDAEVSKRRNHLLKSPFVIHPGTGTLYKIRSKQRLIRGGHTGQDACVFPLMQER